MTTPDEPTTADPQSATSVPREQLWTHIQSVDRNWDPERERDRESAQTSTATEPEPDRVLVPFDGSPPACDALEYTFELFPNADITALLIVEESTIGYIPDPSNDPHDGATSELLAGVPRELEHAIEIAERCGERIQTAGRVGSPIQGVLEYLEHESVDHVVIGSNCRSGLARFLRGSVAEGIVRRSSVPVTILPASSNWGD